MSTYYNTRYLYSQCGLGGGLLSFSFVGGVGSGDCEVGIDAGGVGLVTGIRLELTISSFF